MNEVTTDLSNEPTKQSPWIKLMIFCYTEKWGDLDIRISPGVPFSFESIFACLNTLGTRRRMRFRYLAPRLKSFIFQVLQGNIPTILPLILLKGKQLILRRKLTVLIKAMLVNQKTTFWNIQQIALHMLTLPSPG